MTDVRTFRAASMQQALDLVRDEMGVEAVILHTRHVSHRRLLPWKKPKREVEITAGLGVNVRRQPESRTLRSAGTQQSAAPQGRRVGSAHLPREIVVGTAHLTKTSPRGERPSAVGRSETIGSGTEAPAPPPSSGSATSAESPNPTAEFATKLDSIQKMLEHLGRDRSVGSTRDVPSELFNLYTELIDADVEQELARELIFRLKQNADPAQLSDGSAAKALLTGMVEAEIRCCGPIVPTPGKRKVVALVGATGVGKTTTIAKLAANFRLRDGVKMGLVTVDTYRIAAVEQLRTYAEIIDLPMKVVTSPLEMRRALDELVGLDLVLIDTAGRSPRDELQIQELKTLLAEAHVDEVHLVLNMTASLRSLQAAAEKFSAANTTALIMTKLDEAAGMGALLSVAQKIALPISYLTTGQDVPDDIEPADASRIARLVLGQEKLSD